ncbi:MAG: zinc ribbon domain-containing protein [Candidatus Hodarchaeota archaeon]
MSKGAQKIPFVVGEMGSARRGAHRHIYHRPQRNYYRSTNRFNYKGLCFCLIFILFLMSQTTGSTSFIVIIILVIIGAFLYQKQNESREPLSPTPHVSSPTQRKTAPISQIVSIKPIKTLESHYCVQCGEKLEPGDRFCVECGRKVI